MTIFYDIVRGSLPVAIPLMLVALGGMFSERSGVINIGLEGVMLCGAFTGCVTIYFLQNTSIPAQLALLVAMLVAAIFGILYSFLLSYAAVTLKADQTIVGTAMNMLAPAAVLLISKNNFTKGDGITTNMKMHIKEIPGLSKIPVIGDMFFKDTYITVYIGFVLLAIATVLLYKTRFGLRLRACGEHPAAADSVGVNVSKMRYAGVLISGILGGIGGYFYAVGVASGNCNGHDGVAGYGFLALAVMIFGQWKPIKIMGASLFFALLSQIGPNAFRIPFLANLGISSNYYSMIPYIATMVVLALTSKNSRAPKAEGIPYDKTRR